MMAILAWRLDERKGAMQTCPMKDAELHNPYAAPTADLTMPASLPAAWKSGKHLVVPKGWISPPVCLLTGVAKPLTPLRQAKLSYLHPVWLLFFLLGPVIMILVSIFVTKTGNIYFVLREDLAVEHRRRVLINWWIFLSAGGFLAGVFYHKLFVYLSPVGFLLLIICGILSRTWCRLIKVSKIEGNSIWLAGIPAEAQTIILEREQRKHSRKHLEIHDPFWKNDKGGQELSG